MASFLAASTVNTQAEAVAWVNTQLTSANAARSTVTPDVDGFNFRTFHWKQMPSDGIMAKAVKYVLDHNLCSEVFTHEADKGNMVYKSKFGCLVIVLLNNDPVENTLVTVFA